MTGGGMSEREAEVLAALGHRLTNAQIAARLHISVRTVESHVSSLLRKHGAADRKELAALARQSRTGELAGLPAARTSFVGRSAERAEIIAAFESSRLVTLAGPGGVGKTRLAVAVAGAAAPSFPHGGAFVDLVPVRDGFVAEAVAAALGVAERPGQPLEDAIADRLGRGRALLVLDNCEHLLDPVAALVDRLLAVCPATRALVTSRERLGVPGERVVSVEPLPPGSDAVELFLDRAGAAGFAAGRDVASRICARLDGLPLAIELAAARGAALGADGLLAALDDNLRLLAGGRGGDRRHRSLRTVLGWSHDLLETDERALFRRLAVFAGGFGLDAVVAVTGGSRSAAADVLGRLVDKSLVVHRRDAGGWRLLETVRAFAAERLEESGELPDARRRHLAWAVETADALTTARADDPDTAWWGRFDAVADDLRAALATATGVSAIAAGLPSPEGTFAAGTADGGTGAGADGSGVGESAGARVGVDRATGTDADGTGAGESAGARVGVDGGTGAGADGSGVGESAGARVGVDGGTGTDADGSGVVGVGGEAHRLARRLAGLTYGRRFLREAVARYEQAAVLAPGDGEAARDLADAAECALAFARAGQAYRLQLGAAERARAAGDGNAEAVALARAAVIAERHPGFGFDDEPEEERVRALPAEAAAAGDLDDPYVAAHVAAARAWSTGRPDVAGRALEAARATGDPVLTSSALDAVICAADRGGRAREAYRLAGERLKLLPAMDGDDPRTGIEIVDALHTASFFAVAVGDLHGALKAARMAADDDVTGSHPALAGSRLVPPLVLAGDFDQALARAAEMVDGQARVDAPPGRWMAPALGMVALAHGLRGDDTACQAWRARAIAVGHIGPASRYAPLITFIDARLAIHQADLALAHTSPPADGPGREGGGGMFGRYAIAAVAELAVVRGEPDAAERVAAAKAAGEENAWAAACLKRAQGRLRGDREALGESAEMWGRIGAAHEREATLRLLNLTDRSG
ncbi:LuxR C-terminal-related transcriptional regulator [Nonomuraea sp. NPDC049486]|uniref:ATP-binding protein n=1 Tax=Nonomuraea sp. NPDC049486 TaxID=3155773 RepID=UPI003448FFB8